MAYVLKSDHEFERLERQAASPLYDPRIELQGIDLTPCRRLLDVGSGSGYVSRYLARENPRGQVLGVDASDSCVASAADAAKRVGLSNLEFKTGNLLRLPVEDQAFDFAICRYVLEHMSSVDAMRGIREIHRSLKNGGRFVAIDIDGYLFNLFPQPPRVQKFLARLQQVTALDLQVGRKLPSFLNHSGFSDVEWRIQTLEARGANLEIEARLIEERFVNSLASMTQLLGSKKEAQLFQAEYLETLRTEGAVLFYNKFIVSGWKRNLRLAR